MSTINAFINIRFSSSLFLLLCVVFTNCVSVHHVKSTINKFCLTSTEVLEQASSVYGGVKEVARLEESPHDDEEDKIHMQMKSEKEKYTRELPVPNREKLEVLGKSSQYTLPQEQLITNVPALFSMSAGKP